MKMSLIKSLCAAAALTLGIHSSQAGPNPSFPFYGWGSIIATPSSPIAGEEAHIAVYVTNAGDTDATNVKVKLSFNDWGVTFWGWQEIGEITVPSIAAGGVTAVDFYHTFVTRTHTCLEVLITAADADDNLTDNRGQINLEVINAGGDVFDYNVPIVNNGDEPIQVAVQAHCGGDAAGGQNPGGECPVILREGVFELNPGEEILVPVRVDLRGVLPGGQVIVIVDAFNLLADNPFAPENHNHVQLNIRRTSARALKAQTRDLLNGLAGASTGGTRGKLQSAVNNLDNALKPSNWIDANHITKKGGASVFAAELAAVNTLLGLLDNDLPLGLKEQINTAVNNLTDADRILASNAGGNLGDGDAARAAGDNAGAINAYKHAWQAAQ